MQFLTDFFASFGFALTTSAYLSTFIGAAAYFVVLGVPLHFLMNRLPKTWEAYLVQHRLRRQVWRVFAVSFITYFLQVSHAIEPVYSYLIHHMWTIFAVATTVLFLVLSFVVINIGIHIYETYPISKRIPIRSYTQILKILLGIGAAIIIASILLNKSPLAFFTGLGATVALVSFMFKDTISGFLSSVQLSSYDLIRIGDIVTIPKYKAEGTVREVSLTVVKVENFDKTISMIPTAGLVTDSIRNWRGMFDSGGRRIKKALPIDMESISFLTPEELSTFKDKFSYLTIPTADEETTNLTLYRAFIEHYVRNRSDIHTSDGFLFLIRELDPTENGLPLEFYFFTKDTNWGVHEKVQAEILEYAIASMKQFNLKVFQLYD